MSKIPLWVAMAVIVLLLSAHRTESVNIQTNPELTSEQQIQQYVIEQSKKVGNEIAFKLSLKKWVNEQARKKGVNVELVDCIISHESQWVYNKIGPEKIGASQGLWQIYLHVHPDITLAEANDPIWSTNWALTQIENGHINWWSTYSASPYYCYNIPVMIQ